MTLKQRINTDFIAAFKSGEKDKKKTLSMLKAAITEGEKAEGQVGELTDVQVLAIVQKYDKNLDQTIGLVEGKGGDVTNEKLEKTFLVPYLPTQLTDEQLTEMVEGLMPEGFDISNKNKAVGSVMNMVKVSHAGQYNPAKLKQLIEERITKL